MRSVHVIIGMDAPYQKNGLSGNEARQTVF